MHSESPERRNRLVTIRSPITPVRRSNITVIVVVVVIVFVTIVFELFGGSAALMRAEHQHNASRLRNISFPSEASERVNKALRLPAMWKGEIQTLAYSGGVLNKVRSGFTLVPGENSAIEMIATWGPG